MRPYHDANDGERMLALVRDYPADHVHVVDLPYRLCSWAFNSPDTTGLWEDESGRLLAWAVLQTPFWTLDYGIGPDAPPDAFAALLAWADGRARALVHSRYGRPAWFVAVPDSATDRRHILNLSGYTTQNNGGNGWAQVTLAMDSDTELPSFIVRPDFRLRILRGEKDIPAYVALHRSVFRSENMTEGWRKAILAHPAYRPELDLVVEDAHGALVAFCVAWIATLPQGGGTARIVGQIEPIGVREEARRSGLAWAILSEAARRLRKLGASTILVQTDLGRDRAYAFYRAAGFRIDERFALYRKKFGN